MLLTSYMLVKQLYLLNVTGIELIGPLKEYEGKKYIATAVCYFTKFVKVKAIPNNTGEEVAMFIYELFSRYVTKQ